MIELSNGVIAARKSWTLRQTVWSVSALGVGAILFALPELALAQASPFATGASAMQTNILTILTPIAVIAVIALGAAAWFNRISWSWAVGSMVGIALVFGAPQIVSWVRGMFGV
jgi:type IV secretion system protein VirB2